MTSDMMGTKVRTPTDGKPYYCAKCGLGLAEYFACEEPDCTMESAETAQARANSQPQT